MSEKKDYGASHWSSDKVWKLRKETGDHPELEPSINKVIQLLKEEGLTLREMIFVLTKAENRLILSPLEQK